MFLSNTGKPERYERNDSSYNNKEIVWDPISKLNKQTVGQGKIFIPQMREKWLLSKI